MNFRPLVSKKVVILIVKERKKPTGRDHQDLVFLLVWNLPRKKMSPMANARMVAGLLLLSPLAVMSFTAMPLAVTTLSCAKMPLARSAAGIARVGRSACGAGSALKMQEKGGFDVESWVGKVSVWVGTRVHEFVCRRLLVAPKRRAIHPHPSLRRPPPAPLRTSSSVPPPVCFNSGGRGARRDG